MPIELADIDTQFYERHLADFLPARIIDAHTHVWLKAFSIETANDTRTAAWPRLVAEDSPIEDLQRTYKLMFPQQSITPLVFGFPSRDIDLDQVNAYARQVARRHSLPSLLVSRPEWSAEQLEQRVAEGEFLGLKPYLSFAPEHLSANEVTVYDFLPHHHLEVADAQKWLVMLHIPRSDRLRDPLNLQHMIEIEHRYPNVRLIIAHIGRAYCPEDVGSAFEVLRNTERMCFDFSANTNAAVMEGLLRCVGPQRILFGSDLPIVRMRMRRICEDGVYVNLVPPGLYGNVSGDPHMRYVSQEEATGLSFFLYEELLAFRHAAEATDLSSSDLEDVFYYNAARMISDTGGRI
jgi:predicted TIM-barrel fold metal-dependent hydrolase